MTPKEQAEKLVRKYYSFGLNNPAQSFSWYECKECALIAVDFAKDSNYSFMPMHGGWISGQQYYDEVKQEIERL